MIKNSWYTAGLLLATIYFVSCGIGKKGNAGFDEMNRSVQVNNWKFDLNVENQSRAAGKIEDTTDHYLKATLYLSNTKTKKSLLYSISDDVADYEGKYKYLSFDSKKDLFIKNGDDLIYPIGYVFEPSNGLSASERLVYKFKIPGELYRKMKKEEASVEYWYIDRLVGLGKICFKQQ